MPAPTAPALPAGYVPVYLKSEQPQARYRLTAIDPRGMPAQSSVFCDGPCSLYLLPTRYELSVNGPGIVTGSRKFELERASEVEVAGRTTASKNTGLALGIIGSSLFATGMMLALASDNDRGEGGIFFLGLSGIVTGAVLAPIGWVKFARSAPRVEVKPLGATR